MRLPGLALSLLVLGCAAAPAPAGAPALAATIDDASAARESAVLLRLTRDGPLAARARAVAALGRVGDAPAIARLLELLADPSLRVAAASALGVAAALGAELGDAEAAVLAAWSAADAAQRRAIAPALGRLGTTAATPTLAAALADPDPQLAAAAALALGVLARRGVAWHPSAQPAALALAARPDPALTHAAAYALAHAPVAAPRGPVDDALLGLVAAPDPETRALALLGLTRRKVPAASARPAFQAALADPDPWVQVHAVRGLLGLADDDATAATLAWARAQLPVLADPARAAAAHPVLEALERLAAAPLTPPSTWRGHLPAAQADAEALHARSPTPLLARAACQLAAAAAHDPQWRPPLRCPGDPAAPERDAIEAGVLAAGHGGPDRLPRLQQLFASTAPRVRAAAVTAAGALASEPALAPAIAAMWRAGLADPTTAVVGATAEAIAAHHSATPTATLSPELLADLVDRARRERHGEVELHAALSAALAAAGHPEPAAPRLAPRRPPHDPAAVRGRQVQWRLRTTRGALDIELDPTAAPWHVAALVALTRAGFYDGLEFHRVVPGFVVQGGDPEGTGWGGPGFALPSEPGEAPFTRGAVGIADAGKDSGGSQFFLMHARAPHLEGRYTRVGELRGGYATLDALQVGDRIIRAEVRLRSSAILPADEADPPRPRD